MEQFLVVIPTIRQTRTGFEEVMGRIRATLTMPTEFHILDGSEGKPVALNRALEELLPQSSATIYVTLDDDYVPGHDWQSKIAQAFADLPQVGVCAVWVGDDPELQRIMGKERVDPPATQGKTTFRKVQRGHHIAGAMLCYRREVALQAGPQPITGEKYQIWEDAYRGRRVQSLGWEMAFIECEEPPVLLSYDDPPEYDAWRQEQIVASRKNQQHYLKQSGMPDPWTLRARRWLARVRGRSKE